MTLKIHELPGDPGRQKRKKRVGRGEGSGRGRTAGKGNKGHKARSGGAKSGSFEGGQMPLIRRLPKFGFENTAFREKRAAVTLRHLNRFEDGATIDKEALCRAGLLPKSVLRVKLICKGVLKKRLNVKLSAFSPGAKTAIEALQGTWEVVAS